MKVKLYQLVNKEMNGVNPDLINLMTFEAKNAGLRYDIQTKLAKAVIKEYKNLQEAREALCRSLAVEKEVTIDGEVVKTPFIIEEKEGVKTITQTYDIPIENEDEFNRQLMELLQNEVELHCYPISLRKLDLEPDTSKLNFAALESFIVDDRV